MTTGDTSALVMVSRMQASQDEKMTFLASD